MDNLFDHEDAESKSRLAAVVVAVELLWENGHASWFLECIRRTKQIADDFEAQKLAYEINALKEAASWAGAPAESPSEAWPLSNSAGATNALLMIRVPPRLAAALHSVQTSHGPLRLTLVRDPVDRSGLAPVPLAWRRRLSWCLRLQAARNGIRHTPKDSPWWSWPNLWWDAAGPFQPAPIDPFEQMDDANLTWDQKVALMGCSLAVLMEESSPIKRFPAEVFDGSQAVRASRRHNVLPVPSCLYSHRARIDRAAAAEAMLRIVEARLKAPRGLAEAVQSATNIPATLGSGRSTSEGESRVPPPEAEDDEYRPASWFKKGTAGRLRQAASPYRKTKRVRTRKIDGVVCYSVSDVRRWWPEALPDHARQRYKA